MCDFWENFIIGFLSGGLSSLAVTAVWSYFEKKKLQKLLDQEKETKYKVDFAIEIQSLIKYLETLQTELKFEESIYKSQNVIRAMNSHPKTPTFKIGMNDKGTSYLSDLWSIKRNIENSIKKNELTQTACEEYEKELFELQCEILKNQTSIRKDWEEAKKEN